MVAALTGLVIIVTVVCRAVPMTDEKAQQDQAIADLAQKVEEAELSLTRKTNELQALERDPEYAGLKARDHLDMMKEGETILRIDGKN